MRRVLYAAALVALLSNLGGCVLAVGNDDGPDSSWSDSNRHEHLADAVRDSLRADPLTAAADLTVASDSESGRVYLSGTVHSSAVLQRAVDLALATQDVKSVRCHVTVIR